MADRHRGRSGKLSPAVAGIPSRDPKKFRASDIAGQCLRAFLLECDRAAVARLPLGILEDLARAFGRGLALDMRARTTRQIT